MIILTESPRHHIWLPCLVPHRWVGTKAKGWHILWPCWGVTPYSEQEHIALNRCQKCTRVADLVLKTWMPNEVKARGLKGGLSCLVRFLMILVAVGVFGK